MENESQKKKKDKNLTDVISENLRKTEVEKEHNLNKTKK